MGVRENPRVFRHLLNVWPPYLGAGISVTHIAEDWRRVDVALKARLYNRNYVDTHFGGSLFAMCDPWYMIMLIRALGGGYVVWDKRSAIDYVRPGRGTVTATFSIDDDVLARVRAGTVGTAPVLEEFTSEVVDAHGACVAKIDKVVYVRRRGP